MQKRFERGDKLSNKEFEYLQKNLNNYISIFNVGAKHSSNNLFNKLYFPYGAHIQLDEINKGYNSRLSIDFPAEVAIFWQTYGHNGMCLEITSHRIPEADSKIREIIRFYELIRFAWEFKIYYPVVKKKIPIYKNKKLCLV